MIGKVEPFTPPSINQVAPKDRESRWPLVADVKAPFTGDPPPREFGFWFNYFWEEVSKLQNITPVQQQKAGEAFFSVFEGAQAPFTPRADFSGRDDAFKENVLRQLLLIGFKRVALDSPRTMPRHPGGRSVAPPPLAAGDARQMNLFHVDGKRGQAVDIAFRADARCYEDLCQHRGFRTRARSEDSPVHAAYGLDRAWHPFSNPVYRNSLFLRLGSTSADNCLQTVISVGAEFAGITHFPILNDVALVFQAKSQDGQFLARKPLDEWTAPDEALARSHTQKVRAVRDASGEIDHLEKDNYIYAFHMSGVKVFNTHAFFTARGDAPFPERGAAEIPLENILAEIHFVQKWFYAPSNGQIKLYEVAFDPIRWVPSRAYVEVVIGAQARQQLEAKILSEIAQARSRSDFTEQMVKYRAQLANKANMLTAAERQSVYRALKAYLATPGAKATTSAQKAAVRLALQGGGASADTLRKFDSLGPLEWIDVRAGASKIT